MVIVEFVNKSNRTNAGMKAVIKYILNPIRLTMTFVTGIGVNPGNAYNEMVTLKKLMGKTDKR